MTTTEETKCCESSETKKPGFFGRLFAKLDASLKEKAESKRCGCGDTKDEECCKDDPECCKDGESRKDDDCCKGGAKKTSCC
ncbi:MAG: hypothetical protein ACOCVG_00240 [Verrucomicrobiota bacterium]